MPPKSLISTAKTSDSGLHAALHPLVLLSISDYITRHTLRKQTTPIVGALLGQQNGREITIEHAYDVRMLPAGESPSGWKLDEEFFSKRLQQYKDVHKAPVLELVGWWTIGPPSGPGPEVLGIHEHIMQNYNESALLLTFHPETVVQGAAVGGKLPLTIFESVYESQKDKDEGDQEEMQVEGAGEKLELKLKELGYELQTGEAEMISVDFVARGGGNATAVESKGSTTGKNGKAKEKGPNEGSGAAKSNGPNLNPEEEELISFLTSRANAIRMLKSRITLLKTYLESLPPSYLTTPSPSSSPEQFTIPPLSSDPSSDSPTNGTTSAPPTLHPILRSILALSAKLPLAASSNPALLAEEQAAERSDVALVGLLSALGRGTQSARELGITFASREAVKKQPGPAGTGGPGGSGGMSLGGGAPMGWGASEEGSYAGDLIGLVEGRIGTRGGGGGGGGGGRVWAGEEGGDGGGGSGSGGGGGAGEEMQF